jgi:hypothetical protein
MITVEARTIEQVRNFATLMGKVCGMAEENLKTQSKSALIISYWKAKATKRKKLENVMANELINGSNTGVYRSLDDLVEVNLITEQEAAFCRNWDEGLNAVPAK